jgi:thiol-disulfide isomerase/thioredoxin
VVLEVDLYDSRLEATLDATGRIMSGTWTKTVPDGVTTLPFNAWKGDSQRFLVVDTEAAAGPSVPSVGGMWAVRFTDDDGIMPARGELVNIGMRVTGTFLTPLGDFRWFDGLYRRGRLRLSSFDGAHAFLLDAVTLEDGSLAGDFWSGDSYHATWTAWRPTAEADGRLPSAWTLVTPTDPEQRLRFAFPDLEGRTVSLSDDRYAGKVVIVQLFGTWCPNCHDEAPLLNRWYRRWRDDGLEVVGLAFEYSDDPERSRRQLERFRDHYEIEYPLLIAGVSDKAKAAEMLPDLSGVPAYPTTIFIRRDGRIFRIHSGFAGPATRDHHERLKAEFKRLIDRLLRQPASLPMPKGVGDQPATQPE